MTEEQLHKMGFREWTTHYEKEQEEQRGQIGELSKNVSSLSADVRTLVENQRGMYSRMDRPQAPLIIAGFAVFLSLSGLFASILTLTVNPIKDDILHMESAVLRDDERNSEMHNLMNERNINNAVGVARLEERAAWIERLEDRYNNRLHGGDAE